MKWRWGWGWVVIGHGRGWYPQNKIIKQVIMSYLINYSSSVPLSLSLISTSISLPSMCISLWSSHCWQSQNSEQLSQALIELHLFIYLFIHLSIYLFALGWNTFVAYCLQNVVRCDFYSSWKHGRSQWLFALISLPAIFTWIQLEWINYYTVFPHDCNIKW